MIWYVILCKTKINDVVCIFYEKDKKHHIYTINNLKIALCTENIDKT
jgi:hypothetical protein